MLGWPNSLTAASAMKGSMQRQRHFTALTVMYCVAADVMASSGQIVPARRDMMMLQHSNTNLLCVHASGKRNWTLSPKKKDQLSCLHRVPSDVARDKLLHIKTLARLHTLDSQSRLTCAQHNLSSRTFSDLKNYCWKPQRHEASPSPCTSNMFSWRSGVANRSAR